MCNRVLITLFAFIFIQDGNRKFVAPVDTGLKDKNGSSSSKDGAGVHPSFDLRLSDLVAFEDQLAGHDYTLHDREGKAEKLGLMKDADGNLLKPYPTDYEISFYETLYASSDPVVRQMQEFIPAYYGVKDVLVNEEGKVVKFIHLENIMNDYEMACSMDVKLGLIRIPPGAPPRSKEQENRYKEMMVEWGFGIPGFEYFKRDGTQVKQGKGFGYNMSLNLAVNVLYGFVQEQIGIKCNLVQAIIHQLQAIYNLYREQDYFQFYDSSVLLTYDAKKLFDQLNQFSDSNEPIPSKFNCEDHVPIRVRMLDFGKAVSIRNVPPELRGDDENYLRGIRNLVLLLENLDFHIAAGTFNTTS